MPQVRKDENGNELKKYMSNPFIKNMTVRVKTKVRVFGKDKSKFIAVGDAKTGELTNLNTDGVIMGETHVVEAEQFIKMYAQGMAMVFNLGVSAQKVFACIYREMSKNKNCDTVFIPYRKSMGFSKTTYYKGIKECIMTGLLAQSVSPSLYFINPSYFYNGDRLLLVKQFIKNSKQDINDNQTITD